jgi:hypothetical protein
MEIRNPRWSPWHTREEKSPPENPASVSLPASETPCEKIALTPNNSWLKCLHLADFILRGNPVEARALAERDRASLCVPSTGAEKLYPADIALRCGHKNLVVCLLRLGAPMKVIPPTREALLHDYLGG